MNHLIPDLFHLDTINDRLWHRWSQNTDIAQKDMAMMVNVVAKSLSKCSKDARNIEENDDVDMEATSVESLAASILGKHAEDGTED